MIAVGIEMGVLRRLGWFDFLNFDCQSLAADPVVIAHHAFCYLALEGDSFERSIGLKVLQAVIAFLRKHRETMPSPEHLKELNQMLTSNPVDRELVWDWFDQRYP